MRGKGFKLLFILCMIAIPLFTLLPRPEARRASAANPQSTYGSNPALTLEHYLTDNFPAAGRWRQLWLDLRLLGGQKEHNGIFVSENGLMKNIDSPIEPTLLANINAISGFADYCRELGRPVYLTVIPTASGILKQNLPSFSTVVNQQLIIDDIYGSLIGQVTTINAHSALAGQQSRYIYYRTEDNLTAYGGYLVYSEMTNRMLGLDSTGLSEFNISYESEDFYGDLYDTAPYRDIAPDILSTYRYTAYPREYLVTHTQTSGRRIYHTLFPTQALELGNPMGIYLGGPSAVVDIRTTAPNSRRLLIFGDKTALGYLPFLVNHYRQVTLVDLFHNENLYSSIRPEDYSQILFAYGFESFTTTLNPSRVETFVSEAK